MVPSVRHECVEQQVSQSIDIPNLPEVPDKLGFQR